ncbi:hypothetical protein L1F30_03725 [Simiduia sp. 21SJ11W-1]|uniref:hypothetical protein n=1 Tax=Simiduia sp. 21SJ11W-1 TaxID=2909669 RepID=UPI0020A01FC6|nr:hypothetical protein [Simiduia sp. 21SJ11W-1]UTA48658.1 hypothetical protein L1F30_03725 [Simiduia sp. 21SJ11W-1]
MTLFSKLLAFSVLLMLIALILFVLFGQITVRRLRKTEETKNALGCEFASGWDILNAAQALALPRYITDKLAQSPLSGLYADRDLLEKHTSTFDRGLAKIFWYTYTISVALMLIFIAANSMGLFD